MKFYLMWANHNVVDVWDIRLSHHEDNVIWDTAIDRKEFEKICIRLIENYFKQSNYYTIDEKPVFMIYDTPNLIKGLGGLKETADALQWFRDEAVRRGLKGLHLQMTLWSENAMNLSGVDNGKDINAYGLIDALNYDSTTHYQFAHFADIDRDYLDILKDVDAEWKKVKENISVPYYSHVSVGWDNNPRYAKFRPGVVKNNTPENFKKALEDAKTYVDSHPEQPPLVTINSWNEWTETSYLEPDDLYGYGYLDAIKEVFTGEI